MGEALQIMGLLNQLYIASDLMNWADWLNDYCVLRVMEWFLVWPPIFSVSLTFKCWGTLAVVLSQIFKEKSQLGRNNKKWSKMTQKQVVFFPYFEKMILLSFAGNDLKNDTVFYLTVLIPYLGKLLLLSYSWKGFQPIRLQDSLIHIDRQPEKWKKIQLNFSWVWSVMPKAAHNRKRCS